MSSYPTSLKITVLAFYLFVNRLASFSEDELFLIAWIKLAMANLNLIIKVKKTQEEGHGAREKLPADFVTAMMAFFFCFGC